MHITTFKVNNFINHKKILIDLIKKIPKTFIHSDRERISHSDCELPNTMYREYKEYFLQNIFNDYCKNLCTVFNFKEINLGKLWFQVYGLGDQHKNHTHGGAHFTNVFYINLPSEELLTQVTGPSDQKIILKAEEGDIVTFPAYYNHHSPKNTHDEEKIIISFNIDIWRYAK